MKTGLFIVTLSTLALASAARAATVTIDYVLDSAVASIDPFTVPNPQGGADITVSPAITFDSGTFSANFLNADDAGTVDDGAAAILGMQFFGQITIGLASSVEVFGFPVPVRATISGPLAAQQITDSGGVLTGLTAYLETTVGNFDVRSGPLDCTDNAFGVFCAAIETLLAVEFPLAELGSTTALPFTGGTFSNINLSASVGSSVSSLIDFSFPLGADVSFGAQIDTSWVEVGRLTTVPEPSVSVLLLGVLGLGLRRRRG